MDIPVVLATASGRFKNLMDEVDADAYLQKPISLDHLHDISMQFIHRATNSRVSFLAQ